MTSSRRARLANSSVGCPESGPGISTVISIELLIPIVAVLYPL